MLKNIIKKSPMRIEKVCRTIYYMIPDYARCGKVFRNTYNFLDKSQWWSKEKLQEYQFYNLKKIINHSYETVPYYTRLFNEYDIKPSNIQNFNDFKIIPYLTKEIIQNNLSELISQKYKKKNVKYVTTGGSTGRPMGFYVDEDYDKAIEWAFIAHMWNRVGYNPKRRNKFVILRGRIPNNGIYEYKDGNLILSSFELTENNMQLYIELIERFNPDFIQAYPSSIDILSKYISSNYKKIKIDNLKAIICGSENIYDFQRKNIEEVFKVRVYSFYGHTEHACIGGECEKHNYYHIQSEYGYTELINEYGNEVFREDEIGELVVTGFNNYVVPFIRYKTADMAINTNKKCSCGREYKIIKKLDGRKQEFIITKQGTKIALTSIIFAQHFDVMGKIKNWQIEQNNMGKIVFRIEDNSNLKGISFDEIKRKIEQVTQNQIDVRIEIVKKINRTNRGKYKFLIQNIPI
ncbi:phenylacetate--CoA ligase family protein [Clostridium novyi]